MQAINVKVGETYLVKVSGKICPVRLNRVADDVQDRNHVWKIGGWWGTNLNTGRTVRIMSAAKLRCACDERGSIVNLDFLDNEIDPLPRYRREDGHDLD